MIAWLRRATPGKLPARRRKADPVPLVPVGDAQLPLHIRRMPTARHMTLRLAPDGRTLRMAVPQWCPVAEALAFATARSDWIAAQIAQVQTYAPPRPGDLLPYRGTHLTIAWHTTAPRRPVVDGDTLVFGGPADTVAGRLMRWLESEALRLVSADLADYCARAGHPVPALALSRAQRRWGSCAGNGTIRINWRLVMAPDRVRRSVVAHEVAHLSHFDHSAAFHSCLARLFEGDIAAANGWLKAHGRTLYAPFG